MAVGAVQMLALLVLAHLLADYPLQGDFMAKAKNRYQPIPGVPATTVLLSHAAIHAGFVWLITGSTACAIAELVSHAAIDNAKCSGLLTFNEDQALHLWCKVFYVAYIAILSLSGQPNV